MTGDSPILLLVLPKPEESTAISMWISPSEEMLLWGKMYCHKSAPNCGYWELASGEIWALSASHKLAIQAISARVFVMTVSAQATRMWSGRSAAKAINFRRFTKGKEKVTLRRDGSEAGATAIQIHNFLIGLRCNKLKHLPQWLGYY